MLFNSFGYLFYFLPLAVVGFFACGRWSAWGRLPLAWLTAASLFFYAWWNPWDLPVIVGSMVFNFAMGRWLQRYRQHGQHRRSLLLAGIAGNLLLLGYYKYLFFVGDVVGQVLGISVDLPHLRLPLGISFFTFTQIAYLVDTARGEVQETEPLHYALFVTFFPHLLAGPILHHREMMPQFADAANRRFHAENVARGLFLLAMGLGKKVLIADQLAGTADAGFAAPASLTTLTAWQT
ncbi:MAG: MBOAT family protein, partial [Betaproteobacteria bacterium]|nr:MBOAT family protein [Betaproteobacteria bacterium]